MINNSSYFRFRELSELLNRLENNKIVFFSTGITDSEINRIEKELSVILPFSYKEFLKDISSVGFGPYDIAGYPANPEITIEIRENCDDSDSLCFPKTFVSIYSLGDGSEFCLDTSKIDSSCECPVVAWPSYNKDKKCDIISQSFGDFLLETLWGWLNNKDIHVDKIQSFKPISKPWNML